MPLTGRFWTGKVGTFYLTSNGLVGGKPWRLTVKGGDAFFDPDSAVNIQYAADGTPIHQRVVIDSAGIPFELDLAHFNVTQLATLAAIIKATRNPAALAVRVTLEAPHITIDVMARGAEEWISTGAFSDPIIDDVVFRFVSTGPGA